MKKHLLPLLLLLLWSCNSPIVTPDTSTPPTTTERSILVGCEGNFVYSNASISRYNPTARSVENDAFYNANNFPLGDVLQSMYLVDNKNLFVINNSGKVIVAEPLTTKYLGTIKNLVSPRYIEKISDTKYYISDLYSPSMAVVDPTTYQISSYIHAGRGTEQMVRVGHYVFACSWSFNNQIYRIDTRTDKVVDSLTVTAQPNSIVKDKNDKIWVLSDGGYSGSPYPQQIAALTRINPTSMAIEAQFDFASMDNSPTKLAINSSRDTLYYLNTGFGSNSPSNGLCQMAIEAQSLSSTAFIAESGRLFYGFGIDPVTCEIYISDAIDYSQSGVVFRYSAQGKLLDQFKVGINPGSFCFPL